VPVADIGRRGGESVSGGCPEGLSWFCHHGVIEMGAVERDLLSGSTASGLRIFDRRGGGRLGFGLTSSSCCSLADLKDDGEDGAFSLSTEVEKRRRTTGDL
jgi:hypothetical protein